VGAVIVKVVSPSRDQFASMSRAIKQALVQTFVSHASIEAFYKAVLRDPALKSFFPTSP
jgi:truncated hemoglobin YjbI